MDLKKGKEQGHFYSKKEEARLPLHFLNNNDPAFCSLLFSGPYFGPDKLEQWVQIDWKSMAMATLNTKVENFVTNM